MIFCNFLFPIYFWSEDIIEDIFQNMLEFHSKINISLLYNHNPERGLGILGEMRIILLVDYTVDRETLV